MLKVFFDTNVIIDYFANREGSEYSSRLVEYVISGKLIGYLCAKQITDIYYCLRKFITYDDRIEALKIIDRYFCILPTLQNDIRYCLYHPLLEDFEDSLVDEVVKVNCINYIVTNNIKHFKNSKNAIFSPKEFSFLVLENV